MDDMNRELGLRDAALFDGGPAAAAAAQAAEAYATAQPPLDAAL
jgi:hypothetical protein